jgi:hypothetical protein
LPRDFSSASLHDFKRRNIEFLEDLSHIRRTSCDANPGIPKKTDHLLADKAPGVIDQSDSIFASKLIETWQIAKIG